MAASSTDALKRYLYLSVYLYRYINKTELLFVSLANKLENGSISKYLCEFRERLNGEKVRKMLEKVVVVKALIKFSLTNCSYLTNINVRVTVCMD